MKPGVRRRGKAGESVIVRPENPGERRMRGWTGEERRWLTGDESGRLGELNSLAGRSPSGEEARSGWSWAAR